MPEVGKLGIGPGPVVCRVCNNGHIGYPETPETDMNTYILVLAVALLTLVPVAQGQTATAEQTADEKAVTEYRLTMPAIHKLLAATRAMAKMVEDPAVRAAVANCRSRATRPTMIAA